MRETDDFWAWLKAGVRAQRGDPDLFTPEEVAFTGGFTLRPVGSAGGD